MRIAGNKVLNLKGICINSCCCKFPCVLINIFNFLIFSATMEGLFLSLTCTKTDFIESESFFLAFCCMEVYILINFN